MGADVTVDSSKENLEEIGTVWFNHARTNVVTVMRETDGDGIGCIVDASGVPSAVNNCFTMLR